MKKLLGGFTYIEGKKYSQFLPGDKVAKYGLTALVVGGAVGLAAKAGFFAKLAASFGKLWKPIIAGLVAVVIGLKKLVFGRRAETVAAGPPPPPPDAPAPPAPQV